MDSSHLLEGCASFCVRVLDALSEAAVRARAAPGHVPMLRVSFVKVLELARPLWLMSGVFDDMVNDRQKNQIVRRLYDPHGPLRGGQTAIAQLSPHRARARH